MSEISLASEFTSPTAILVLSPEELADRLLPLARHIAGAPVVHCALRTGRVLPAYTDQGGGNALRLLSGADARVHCQNPEPGTHWGRFVVTYEVGLEDLKLALKSSDRYTAAQYFARRRDLHPRFLYKFAPGSGPGLRGIIEKSQLWLASRRDFNDPFELHVNIEFEGTYTQRLLWFLGAARRTGIPLGMRHAFAEHNARNGDFAKVGRESYERNVDSWGICCFTLDPRDVLMWAYYARNQRGVCYQFHGAHAPADFYDALPVKYSDETITINWLDTRSVTKKLGDTFFTKAARWSNEKEHRIIRQQAARSTHNFNPAGLTGVVLGCEASRFLQLRVTALCRRRHRAGMPRVKIFRVLRQHESRSLYVARASDLEQTAYR